MILVQPLKAFGGGLRALKMRRNQYKVLEPGGLKGPQAESVVELVKGQSIVALQVSFLRARVIAALAC